MCYEVSLQCQHQHQIPKYILPCIEAHAFTEECEEKYEISTTLVNYGLPTCGVCNAPQTVHYYLVAVQELLWKDEFMRETISLSAILFPEQKLNTAPLSWANIPETYHKVTHWSHLNNYKKKYIMKEEDLGPVEAKAKQLEMIRDARYLKLNSSWNDLLNLVKGMKFLRQTPAAYFQCHKIQYLLYVAMNVNQLEKIPNPRNDIREIMKEWDWEEELIDMIWRIMRMALMDIEKGEEIFDD